MEYLQIIRVQHLWFSRSPWPHICLFILGSLSFQNPPSIDDFLVIRSLRSLRNWRVGHVIDRNRCGLCHPVVRQLLVVFCPLALRARPGPEHLEWSFWTLCCFLACFHSASHQQLAVLTRRFLLPSASRHCALESPLVAFLCAFEHRSSSIVVIGWLWFSLLFSSVLHKLVQRNWLSYSWLSLQWYIHFCICSRS